MPTTLPLASSSGPPELPGFTDASVWSAFALTPEDDDDVSDVATGRMIVVVCDADPTAPVAARIAAVVAPPSSALATSRTTSGTRRRRAGARGGSGGGGGGGA